MRLLQNVLSVSVVMLGGALSFGASAASQTAKEDYIREPMPAGFQVVVSELEGPVFADATGHTLYRWARRDLRNGAAGEVPNKPTCDNNVVRENGGFMSPYPGGFEMPEIETRPSCAQVWPPAVAAADAKAIGKFTVVDRPDGRKQWAYDGMSLYTSVVDKLPGDVNGASLMDAEFDFGITGAVRRPVVPQPNIPSQFQVYTSFAGRSVELQTSRSVYYSDRDNRNKSNCTGACLDDWEPILAPDYTHAVGEWTTFERSPGIRQWAFRGMPVYRYLRDSRPHSEDGADVAGWHNAYTQKAPALPKGLAMKDTNLGTTLGDERGKTLYRYMCTDDASDQLACDYPEATQVYRLTVCGGGDPDRCNRTFPYALAPVGAKTGNQVWGTMYVNPKTGRRANAGDAGAVNVWTFRSRPMYTFAGRDVKHGDAKTDDANGNGWGEYSGRRTGFLAMVYMNPFMADK